MRHLIYIPIIGLLWHLGPGPTALAQAAGIQTGKTSVVVHQPASRYPVRGVRGAPLNILYWGPFKSDSTKQVQPLLSQLLSSFRGQVRLQFMNKYRDGTAYQAERYAAEVAREAFEQGGDRLFWKFHDTLLKSPSMYLITNTSILQAAQAAGLNRGRLAQAITNGRHNKKLFEERDLATRLGIPTYNSSPVLLVGSEVIYISHYTRAHYLHTRVKYQLAEAQKLQRAGKSVAEVHQQLLAIAMKRYRRWRRYGYRRPQYSAHLMRRYAKRQNIPIGPSPAQGPKTAWVTVVAFLDFTDYRSYSAWNSLLATLHRYPKRLRLVFKALPRRYYSYALGSARAAYAAQAQGKFWEFAKVLFANRWRLYPSRLPTYAQQAGLDVSRFTRDSRTPAMSQRVLADMQLARTLGVTTAPTVFINGRQLPFTYWNQHAFEQFLKKELKGGLLGRLLGR